MASVKKIEGKNGVSYKITVCSGRDALDRQIRHYKTWKPDKGMTARQIEKELKRVVYEFERSIDYGFQVDNRQTFAEYSEYVYKLREMRGDKPHTLARVRREMKRINEHIGHIKLLDIRPRHLNALYKKLTEPGSNHNWVYAVPVVDFNELRGEDSYRKFAQKCGVYYRLIAKLCKGQQISQKNAAIIEKNLGRKDLFKIVGAGQILSPRTIRTYHSIISVVLEQAVKEMILPYNPATRVTLPPIKNARPADTLQPDTIQSVLKALETEPIEFRTMITLFIVILLAIIFLFAVLLKRKIKYSKFITKKLFTDN